MLRQKLIIAVAVLGLASLMCLQVAKAMWVTGSVNYVNNSSQAVRVSTIWGLGKLPTCVLSPGQVDQVRSEESPPSFIIDFDSAYAPKGPGQLIINDGFGGHIAVFSDQPGGNIHLQVNKN